MGLRLPPEFERFGPWDKLPGIPDDGGLDMVNRTRNDNVSGRVPLSAKAGGTDPAVKDAIARVAAALRRGAWDEARGLVEKLAASAAG